MVGDMIYFASLLKILHFSHYLLHLEKMYGHDISLRIIIRYLFFQSVFSNMDELEQGDVALTNLLEILDKVDQWSSEMHEILNLKQEVVIDVE